MITPLVLTIALGQPGQTQSAYLSGLVARIDRFVKRSRLNIRMNRADHDIVVQYKPGKFMVFGASKARALQPARQEVGPTSEGFIMEVNLFDHKRGTPAPPIQAVKVDGRPFTTNYDGGHWFFDYWDRQVPTSDLGLHVRLAWGARFDPSLRSKLVDAATAGTDPIAE